MTLRWKQILPLTLLSIVLWAWVTYQLRTHPEKSLDPHKALIQFLIAPIGGVVSIWLCKVVGRLGKDQILAGVSLVGAVAMMLDGFALGWTSNLYGFDEKALRLGAAGLLWGYGVAFAVALLWVRFQGRIHTPTNLNE
jgi:hypothetical protein